MDSSDDLLANGWIPSPCFDEQMHHDAVHGQDYGFFEDFNATIKVHQDVIMKGNVSMFPDGLWVTEHEHLVHCRYLVNTSVMATARQSIGTLDTWLEHDGQHMQHCMKTMEDRPMDMNAITHVKAVFEYHRCYLRRG